MSAALLSVLLGNVITRAMLVSSTATADAAAAWNAATPYVMGDLVQRPLLGFCWKRAVAGTTATAPENDPINWVKDRPINDWAMLDDQCSTQTTANLALTTVLTPGYFNSIFLTGIEGATELHVSVKNAPGGAVTFTFDDLAMELLPPSDMYEYWYVPPRPKRNVVLIGIEPFYNAELTISLVGSGTVKLGMLSIGDLRPIGELQRGADAEPVDFSYVAINARGENTIVKGKNALDLSASAIVKLIDANDVVFTLLQALGRPCAWIGSSRPEHEALRVFGLGKGKLSYPLPNECVFNGKVEGLI
jgi:hypothetical protein